MPNNKTPINIALICKQFYALVKAKEVGLNDITNTTGLKHTITYFVNTQGQFG